jgi:hypothetical protein
MGQRQQDLELPLLSIGELAHRGVSLLPEVPLLQQALRFAQDVLVAGEGRYRTNLTVSRACTASSMFSSTVKLGNRVVI